jgi:hypothetical protein
MKTACTRRKSYFSISRLLFLETLGASDALDSSDFFEDPVQMIRILHIEDERSIEQSVL